MNATPEPVPPPWRHRFRGLISVLLLIHVTAIALAPLHFATQGVGGASPLTSAVRVPLRRYIGLLYLEHGYFFFAPNPGPNHLVRVKVTFDDGREPVDEMFPDLQRHFPRLLYHRHFMLSESLNGHMVPNEPPPEPPPPPESVLNRTKLIALRERQYAESKREWAHQRRRYDALWDSFVKHLESVYPGGAVKITRIEHLLPTLDDVHEGKRKLNDPVLYQEMDERAEAVPPPPPVRRFPGNLNSPLRPEPTR